MSEFKFRSASGWTFRFELSGFSTISDLDKFGHPGLDNRTIRFICNFGPNSQENFIKTTSDKRVWSLKNRIRVPSHKISVTLFKDRITNSDIQTTWSGQSDIWIWVRVWPKCPTYSPNRVLRL